MTTRRPPVLSVISLAIGALLSCTRVWLSGTQEQKSHLIVFVFNYGEKNLTELKAAIENNPCVLRSLLRRAPSLKTIPVAKKQEKRQKKVELKDIDKKIEEIFKNEPQ